MGIRSLFLSFIRLNSSHFVIVAMEIEVLMLCTCIYRWLYVWIHKFVSKCCELIQQSKESNKEKRKRLLGFSHQYEFRIIESEK